MIYHGGKTSYQIGKRTLPTIEVNFPHTQVETLLPKVFQRQWKQ